MRSWTRRISGLTLSLAVAGSTVAACVGDDPGGASASGSDSAVADTTTDDVSARTDSAPSTDGSPVVDAPDPYDGANASCNGLEPNAPQATVFCVASPPPLGGTGGPIVLGRYKLITQETFFGANCSSINTTPYSDVIEIAQGDSSTNYDLTVALDGPFAARFVLQWNVVGLGSIKQSNICPTGDTNVYDVDYSTGSDGGIDTLTFFLAPSLFTFERF